jgi:general stress protein 26
VRLSVRWQPPREAADDVEKMEIASFDDVQVEFMARVQRAVYCNVATVDRAGRPRSRIMHLVWDGPTGWGITRPDSHKAKHLAHNRYVSIAYISDKERPVYVDGIAEWVVDASEKQRIWRLHVATPPPLGFDPSPHYGTIDHPYFGLLRITPWRVELANLGEESIIWRP